MAFEHFRERRLENFACYAPAIGRYPIDRVNAFRDVVTADGFSCNVFAQRGQTQGWEVDHDHVVEWLAKLPRPLAVFAADPYPARQLAEICELNGIAVPDDVAILSGDNDDLMCSVSSPQLSSIQLACARIGKEAAKMLTELMNGGKVSNRPTLIPPLHVNARRSTDVMAIDDPEIVVILRYMADNIQQAMSVADLLQKFPISRRSLEQKFRQMLDRSPAEQIRQLRMEYVVRLLKETDLTITEIAFRSGFKSSSSLSQQVMRHLHTSPTTIRAKSRQEQDMT
jgi:LacI family transcriptional regulator